MLSKKGRKARRSLVGRLSEELLKEHGSNVWEQYVFPYWERVLLLPKATQGAAAPPAQRGLCLSATPTAAQKKGTLCHPTESAHLGDP